MADYAKLHREAHEAGMRAAKAAIPTPMVVYEAEGLSDRPKEGGKSWLISEGVCGFAWVNIRDARKGFARWVKNEGIGRTDSYYGGVKIWVSQFGQSMTRKEAYADAYAKVLRDNGVTAYSHSRMD
jgi:hypothetical protein